jgi:hypothetical protein
MSTPANRLPAIGDAVAPGLPGQGAGNANLFTGNDRRGPNPAIEQSSSTFSLVDGPLAPLEGNYEDFRNRLTYPQDLGTNNQYKYVMRMLIFRQRKGVDPFPLITPNLLDRSYRASQEGRLNTDVLNLTTGAAIGAAVAGGIVTNVLSAISAKGSLGAFVGDKLSSLASGGLQLGGAAITSNNLDSGVKPSLDSVTEPLSYINLYMPDGLNFVDRHDYDSVSVTDALGGLGLVGSGNTTEIAARLGEQARVAGVSLLGQNITDLALYNTGYALNPQLQVLYKGSKNREFVFTFKLVPRNSYEALIIETIIRTLRYHAAPDYDTTGIDGNPTNARYFVPPSQFEIEFLVMTQEAAVYNDKMPRIAKCVLTNVDVNYAPSGQFAAYQDYQPVETQLQLTFTETVVLTKPDIAAGY